MLKRRQGAVAPQQQALCAGHLNPEHAKNDFCPPNPHGFIVYHLAKDVKSDGLVFNFLHRMPQQHFSQR